VTDAAKQIPRKIRLIKSVASDLPFPPFLVAHPGEYQARCNQHGAVSVEVDGHLLGIKPNEMEVVEWVGD